MESEGDTTDLSSSNWDSDDSGWIAPWSRFGDSQIIAVIDNPQAVRHLISNGARPSVNDLLVAIHRLLPDSVRLLLEAGVNPNARLGTARATPYKVPQDLDYESKLLPPDETQWYPLHHAASLSFRRDWTHQRRAQSEVVHHLLDHGADIHAVFEQPVSSASIIASHLPSQPLQRAKSSHDNTSSGLGTIHEHHASEWRRDDHNKPWQPRILINALIEDGLAFQCVFTHPKVLLDLEHRDPLGRTILHAACRSALGADASSDGELRDLHWDPQYVAYSYDIFTNPRSTLYQSIASLGADVGAVDQYGKTILHHLLESANVTYPDRPPRVRRTVIEIINAYPGLVNVPDNHGTYPLHSALQRLRSYLVSNAYYILAELDSIIIDLVDRGADIHVKDGAGNNALHYLADSGVTEPAFSDHKRQLFKAFLDNRVAVNDRNRAGQCAAEVLLDYHQRMPDSHIWYNAWKSGKDQTARSSAEIDNKVFTWLDAAGQDWKIVNPSSGQTLLHVIAKRDIVQSDGTRHAARRARFCLDRGIDAAFRDTQGQTALDIARASDNDEVARLLMKGS